MLSDGFCIHVYGFMEGTIKWMDECERITLYSTMREIHPVLDLMLRMFCCDPYSTLSLMKIECGLSSESVVADTV
jgi:hypothetical protein